MEEELSHLGHASVGRRCLDWQMACRTKKRQVKGPAGAVMCETPDLRIKWLRPDTSVRNFSKGAWPDPTRALLRRRTNVKWTDKHRDVMRKVVVG